LKTSKKKSQIDITLHWQAQPVNEHKRDGVTTATPSQNPYNTITTHFKQQELTATPCHPRSRKKPRRGGTFYQPISTTSQEDGEQNLPQS